MRKLERQKNVWQTNQDVKINRTIEECNKYKNQLDSLRAEMKVRILTNEFILVHLFRPTF